MEQKGCYIYGDKGSEVKLRYEYKMYYSTLEVTFYGIDLANLLGLSNILLSKIWNLKRMWKHNEIMEELKTKLSYYLTY